MFVVEERLLLTIAAGLATSRLPPPINFEANPSEYVADDVANDIWLWLLLLLRLKLIAPELEDIFLRAEFELLFIDADDDDNVEVVVDDDVVGFWYFLISTGSIVIFCVYVSRISLCTPIYEARKSKIFVRTLGAFTVFLYTL